MTADLISLRVLLVSQSATDRELLRQGAGLASVPAEIAEADGAASAGSLLAGNIDLVLLDAGLSAADKTAICKAARGAQSRPFIFTVGKDAHGVATDGSVRKPASPEDAQTTVDCCIRSRLPTRALIVDDSSTMRGIVRKILGASKFPMEFAEADEGAKALGLLREGEFDIVFLDYNMPGLNGFETLSELRRSYPKVAVAIMTSTDNESFASRARAAGAAAFLKKPFFPADIDAVLYRHYGITPPGPA